MDLMLALALGVALFGSIMVIRNVQVYRENIRVLDLVSEASRADIRAGREWKWRYELFERVSYGAMLHKFWKPVGSFHDARSWHVPAAPQQGQE